MQLARMALALLATRLVAQSPESLSRAAETITDPDIMRRVAIIADDSMMGRDNPSRGLELTAAYVASEFQRAGLKPAGDGGSYFQRFGITRWVVDTGRSEVEFTAGGVHGSATVGVDARFIDGPIPPSAIRGSVVVLAGMARPGNVRGRIVLWVADLSRPAPASLSQQVSDLAAAGPKAVLVLSNRDSATFVERLRMSALPHFTGDAGAVAFTVPVLEVHQRRLGPVLAAAGIDPEQLRERPEGERSIISGLTVEVRLARRILSRARLPNVVGVLEGSDSALRNEYLVYSAHIDHIGVTPGRQDSINNGADDNASGVAGLLELAEAFTQSGVRPRRSIIFLAPSAEEPGLIGSAYFTEHPPVPLQRIIADINMDLIGRNWRDSVIAVGMELSNLGHALATVVAAHPELRMTPIADRWPEERIFYRSDHFNFARRGVPILFFTSGTHPDYHRPTDEPGRIDGEKESRLLRLLFFLGSAITRQDSRPQWNAESYRQVVDRK